MAERHSNPSNGLRELRAARRSGAGLFAAVLVFSTFVNLLMLTAPLYMLQVYDRVLSSRSEETLLALSILVAFLFLIMGLLDYARGRVMARAAARFQSLLDGRVFSAVLRQAALAKGAQSSGNGLRELEAVQRLMGSPALMAFFDIPWTPFFLFAIFMFQPWLGVLALGGGVTLVIIALLNQIRTRNPVLEAGAAAAQADHMAGQLRSEAETVRSLGMQGAAFSRWQQARLRAQQLQLSASDGAGGFSVLTKTLRMFLQSAMLGLGAFLVLQGQMTAGGMIAGSIMLGRALAPVELAISQWALLQTAVKGWRSLGELLSDVPQEAPRTALPRPKAKLDVQQLTVVPPGEHQASLRMVSFSLEPGTAVGVIGPSGSGKSTLARALTGVWRPAGGRIRLDGATLDQYDPDVLGSHIGYLPQRVTLFDGTIAENIAKLALQPDAEKVVAAAKKAAAHDMIVQLPDGYDTRVTTAGGRLSGGQIQRIGLARAMYGDPVLLVLDEPNSNLDNEGSQALNSAIRQMKAEGASILIMAHRPAAIQECDLLLVLDGGTRKAFGPRDEVLRGTVKNHSDIQRSTGTGGVS
ncbi:MAG: type I secretion system permease/ATPase [Confluentimicrobium sp.]|jgi:ATP-binding cassette subfamily C protein|uniref:type I secretion system permease/ATPase n=1 Tax=Actibacterium sp. TaxID=1872125 RepID=UPI000C47E2B9|nr:type I secretion system permease/ATPase [Actibacterium sp.]MBC56811.1 type I secretion system permease/ATPase [Actibacterium sp.]MDY6861222.1 type I secretion system permease/ATPase [Pseudomonadota bacterium]|tara:strand:- start:2751 stop:4493 length:1743 start_codon:yes stop_codon:yes gene_type:complete